MSDKITIGGIKKYMKTEITRKSLLKFGMRETLDPVVPMKKVIVTSGDEEVAIAVTRYFNVYHIALVIRGTGQLLLNAESIEDLEVIERRGSEKLRDLPPLELLRKQINRDRAYIRAVKKDRAEPATLEMVYMRKCDLVTQKKALKKMKNARPVYRWLKPGIINGK